LTALVEELASIGNRFIEQKQDTAKMQIIPLSSFFSLKLMHDGSEAHVVTNINYDEPSFPIQFCKS
jgi:hypothetical protein